ncbi:unnamed protein product [Rotaria sordida]|uniref:Alpha-ketoglutarate-dependent dioxygenase AlkB-like domain-containing protein n=1 Tax=Rotaria sordida TaxID=392033 RepID=A0A819X867_9BILA|nr:unnamed protein product [Rotaria sordida]CAF4138087.1 unnamed protein product [Rotaria sordida]
MSRHVDDIKNMLFDEPDFDSDNNDDEIKSKTVRRKQRKKLQKQLEEKKKPSVETIAFRDPSKKKKILNKSNTSSPVSQQNENVEFDLEKARFDVHKFGIKGFEKSKYEDARVALAVNLGARPPKRKFINYRELIEQNRAKKAKEKEEEENARLLGDIFHKSPNNKQKSKQKRIGEGDVGLMRFSSVGKFQGGVLKLTDKDISKLLKQHSYRLYSSQVISSSSLKSNPSNIIYSSQKVADLLQKQSNCLQIFDNYLTDNENNNFLKEIDGYMKRKRYEYSHWDNAIHGYRESERSEWTPENQQVLSHIRQLAFDDPTQTLVHVHVLDIAKDGYIKPHIDAIRYCGTTIAGLSLLSSCVMRFVHKDDKTLSIDVLLKPKSLYIIKNIIRFDFTHEILKDQESYFNNIHIPRNRRLSIICRNMPVDPSAG